MAPKIITRLCLLALDTVSEVSYGGFSNEVMVDNRPPDRLIRCKTVLI